MLYEKFDQQYPTCRNTLDKRAQLVDHLAIIWPGLKRLRVPVY